MRVLIDPIKEGSGGRS